MQFNKPIYRQQSPDGGDPGAANPPADPPATPPADPVVIPAEFVAPELGTILSEEYKTNPALVDIKNSDDLAKGYLELKAYQGKSIHIPGEDASDEVKAAFNERMASVDGVMLKPNFDDPDQSDQFYQSMGVPKDKTEYKYTPPEDIPVAALDSNRITEFQDVAKKHNLTKKQFQGVINDIVASDTVANQQMIVKKEADQAALVTEWGQAHQQNMDIAINVAKLTGAPENFVAAMEAGDTNSGINKWMYGLSKKFQGEGMNFDIPGGGEAKMTPMEAKEKIAEIMGNNQHPYWNMSDPGNKDAIAKMVNLTRIANPQ